MFNYLVEPTYWKIMIWIGTGIAFLILNYQVIDKPKDIGEFISTTIFSCLLPIFPFIAFFANLFDNLNNTEI